MTNTWLVGKKNSHFAGARVGLEQTFFRVTEGVGVVEICAVVFEPDIECPIKFPFTLQLYTDDATAGNHNLNNIQHGRHTIFFLTQLI